MSRQGLAVVLSALGALILLAGVAAATLDRTVVSSSGFGDATARALDRPAVRAAVGERIADAAIAAEPDLVAARPLVESAATAVVGSRPFRALVRGAAADLHRSVFERDSGTVSLVVADALVLVADALRTVDPQLAAKLPERVRVGLVDFSGGLDDDAVADALQTADRVRALRLLAFPLALALFAAAVALGRPSRRAAVVRVAVALGAAGAAAVVLEEVGEALVRAAARDDLRDAAAATWDVFAGELRVWGLALLAVGVVVGGAAASLVSPRPLEPLLRRFAALVATPPERALGRAGRALALVAAGAIALLRPSDALRLLMLAGGLVLLHAGVAELLRLTAAPHGAPRPRVRRFTPPLRSAAVAVVLAAVVLGGAAAASALRTDDPPQAVTACNGSAALCDRPLAQVAFAGTHNAMAAAPDDGWLFAAQDLTIPQQLARGVRALLVDTHYGVRTPRGVYTLLEEGTKSRAKIEEPLGREFVATAERLRARIGFRSGDDARRDVWLCHAYCEVGATRAVDALREVHEFLVREPGEIVVLSLEDGVTPQDMEEVMRDAGLLADAWTGPVDARGPTLREMVDAGRRLLVLAEERTGGKPWLHPQFGVAQETPFAFGTAAELRDVARSCRRNRGEARNPLFLLNHWVDTPPAPRPSNARTVNARGFLLDRIRRCTAARDGLRPGIVAVDFAGVGDVLDVVETLNR